MSDAQDLDLRFLSATQSAVKAVRSFVRIAAGVLARGIRSPSATAKAKAVESQCEAVLALVRGMRTDTRDVVAARRATVETARLRESLQDLRSHLWGMSNRVWVAKLHVEDGMRLAATIEDGVIEFHRSRWRDQ